MSENYPVLIAGYGNVDREDDGAAWHVLARLARRLDIPFAASIDEYEFIPGHPIDIHFSLQLIPEMAEMLPAYARVLFVDAHTGAVPEEIHVEDLVGRPESSPFTHHMTPAALLNLASLMTPRLPPARLISVRGYSFGFREELSERTDALVEATLPVILEWLGH